MRAFITGSGTFLPTRVVSNADLGEQLHLDPAQIFKSSGIHERRWADKSATTSSLAGAALKEATENARMALSDIDYLLLGTMTADRFIPGASSAIQAGLGLREIPCLDIRAACCNLLYGLQVARALVASGVAHDVAISVAEIQSRFLDLSPFAATTSMLFGDGAAAVILTSEPGEGALEVVDVYLATDGKYVDDLGIRSPGSEFGTGSEPLDCFPRMVGQSVILQASRRMVAASRTVLERNGLLVDEVSWVVPHQANANLLAQVARGLGLKDDGKVVSVIEKTGNTSSASMGIALDKLRRSGSLRSGDYVLMPAFAAGFTWGAGLCRVV
jgi:3-oxoacyl-[acyl-carrier-protein] synthase-3